MSNVLKELEKIERELKQATAEKNQAEGAKKSILSGMKKSYDVETVDQAKGLLEGMEKEQEDIANQIETKFEDLQEDYSW